MLELFGGLIKVSGISFFMLVVAVVILLGYLLGRITVKGVSLGTAGVFIVALLFGAIFKDQIAQISITAFQITGDPETLKNAKDLAIKPASDYGTAFKAIENLGLIFFVSAVGFIAGPNFFKNLKKNFKSYILLGLIIIVAGALSCAACYFIGQGSESDHDYFVSMLVGLLSGSLTSTPAFSAAKASVVDTFAANDAAKQAVVENAVTVGHGIAYLFGVVGVVLFVQLIPKLMGADMDKERELISIVDTGAEKKSEKKLLGIDAYGLFVFGFAATLGIIIGAIRIPLSGKGFDGTCFALTTTGGALLTALVFGHFGHIGRVSLKVDKKILEVFRELGLMLFLIGAGVPGGVKFVENFKPIYFVYGIIMTLVPMIIGFLFAKFVLKLPLLNNLGSITGGMTSTPALGTLINVAGTDDVASAYAATYPIALIAVVLASQFLIIFL